MDEVVVVPSGGFALESQGSLSWRQSDQVVCHVFDGAEVGRSVIGSQAALVVAEYHVHDPVQAVLDGPMATQDRCQQARHQRERRNVETCVPLDLVTNLTLTLNDRHGIQARPVVTLA